jgi:TBC1 domain family protein 5
MFFTTLSGTLTFKVALRSFPDIAYFKSPAIRRILLTILFIWSFENPDVGYRQGMHELLAVLLMTCDRDSLSLHRSAETPYSPLASTPEDTDAPSLVLDRDYLEHDTYALFVGLMDGAKGWYEWRSETVGSSPRRQAKIIEICNHLQGVLIRKIDPVLSGRLEAEGVEGQIWAM